MVISYESMILLAGLTNLLGMMALTRLPEVGSTAPYDPRFTEDRNRHLDTVRGRHRGPASRS